jgi:DNA polymerase III epsilon subunit-like protein
MILFLDTETNCFIDETDETPRLIQLSWILEVEKSIIKKNYFAKPSGFSVSKKAYDLHGISTDFLLINGIEIEDILCEFEKDLEKSVTIVSHNFEFDEIIILKEAERISFKTNLPYKYSICTMEGSLSLFDKNKWIKYPKLNELYEVLFEQGITIQHNADKDVEVLRKCYWKLHDMHIL